MAQADRQQTVLNILQNLRDLEGLKKLFWEELNYERENKPLSSRGWPDSAKDALADDPILFASGGEEAAFHIVYLRLSSNSLLRGLERPVVNQLIREHPYCLFVFSDKSRSSWHFLNVKYEQDVKQRRLLRRISVGPEERLRTASERLSLIDLSQVGKDLFGLSPMAIQDRHDEAFDVEAVTKQFFIEYRSVFQLLQDDLSRQSKDTDWAHDYALQLLNRCMFLYFIQRKRWLGQDNEFLRNYWETYQSAEGPKDSFFSKWLKVLFFEAFNQKVTAHHRHFPEDIRKVLATAPYLNGGLFTPNDLDDEDRHSFTISDARFSQVFKFLERYNFTIAEDSPLDQEVAVDPEMIGKVYESLVNVSSEADERGDAGIFYTPRTEIDLMCRLTLVDQLSNHVGEKHRNLFYELVFAIESDEKVQADAAVEKTRLWPTVIETLRNLTVVDPACGSGSFLVGMLHVLDDLQDRAQKYGAPKESAFERRKRVIGQNLYGVDVMDWACHVAELRLWLALVVDAQFSQAELAVRKEPLLPHFTFKIRQGDSLVQEVGGVNLGRLHASRDIKPTLKARITALKNEKLKFYQNTPDRKYRTADQIRQEELRLFRDILDARVETVEAEIKSIRQRLEGKTANLFGEQVAVDDKLDSAKQRAALEARTAELEAALGRARQARATLKTVHDVPFVWDIAFVEVFEDENDGFDIVIGNPPYVRQENIADPCLARANVTTANKRDYKEKLARAVYQAFPIFFGYDSGTDRAARKLDAKSDLYIYFHFIGLWLLNPNGTFAFICSNAWLDVGYGADLQEFLLRQCRIRFFIDNLYLRSFSSADINTVIEIFSAPTRKQGATLDGVARFVMFKAPFESILSAAVFQEIESAKKRLSAPAYRVCPDKQQRLLDDGSSLSGATTAIDEEEGEPVSKKSDHGAALVRESTYIGNKWGGKYLRAPDVFHRIRETAGSFLTPLATLGRVRYPIKTGINDFFYVSSEKIREFGLEEQFLVRVVKSPKEFRSIRLHEDELSSFLFSCPLTVAALKKQGFTGALNYIKWGAAQKTVARQKSAGGVPWPEAPSVKGRDQWYTVDPIPPADVICNRFFNERFFFGFATFPVMEDQTFYGCTFSLPKENHLVQIAILNTTLQFLLVELLGRVGLGEGVLQYATYEMAQMLTVNSQRLKESDQARICRAFRSLSERPILPISQEVSREDRRILDDSLFGALGLSQAEGDAVRSAVVQLVEARLRKAESAGTTELRKRQKAADSLRGIWSGVPDNAMKELLE